MNLLNELKAIKDRIIDLDKDIDKYGELKDAKELTLKASVENDSLSEEVRRDIKIYSNMIEHKKQEKFALEEYAEKLTKQIDEDVDNQIKEI